MGRYDDEGIGALSSLEAPRREAALALMDVVATRIARVRMDTCVIFMLIIVVDYIVVACCLLLLLLFVFYEIISTSLIGDELLQDIGFVHVFLSHCKPRLVLL